MNRYTIKKWTYALLTLCAAAGVYQLVARFCEKQTDTFTIAAISSSRPFDPEWQTRPLSIEEKEEVGAALSQRYHYFGKGGQCYAFFSEDGQYVLKFFKQRVYTIPLWHHFIPIPYLFDRYKEKKRWKREDKLQRDFFSYRTAFEKLQEITQVLCVHLNPTQEFNRTVSIVDLLNIEHQIPIDRFNFILQKRAEMIYPTILRLIQTGEIDQVKQIIDHVVGLIVFRCRNGYEDWDPNIRTNCGLLNNKVIKIDVGRFIHNDKMKTPEMCTSELLRITSPFKQWLKTQNPDLADYCDTAIAKALSTL